MPQLKYFLALCTFTHAREPNKWNFYFNGGGIGRVSYRSVHVGSGVAFIS
jgi:hypothetical protein